MSARLTESQLRVLRWLAEPNEDGYRRIHGRGPITSAYVLQRIGFAHYVGIGFFNGEHWCITDAGKAALAEAEKTETR